MKNKNNNKGFTLVELIIVVAIIAVLAAVLAPQYLQYVERTRESNDVQVATHLLRAAQVAIADPKLGIPSGVLIEVAWSTDEHGAKAGSLFVRSPVDKSALSGTAPNIDTNDPALAAVDEAISDILAAEVGEQNDSAINDFHPAMIDEAQSALGNSVDFIFHINTATGDIAIADHCKVWVEDLNVSI